MTNLLNTKLTNELHDKNTELHNNSGENTQKVTSLTNETTLLDMMWYPKSWTTLKPIEVVISSGLGEKHLVKQIPWSTFQTAIELLIHQAEIKARLDGRRIQAEATLNKWNNFDQSSEFRFGTFLQGQVDSHKYELEALEKEIV